MPSTRECQQCGKPFEAQRSTAKFCSSSCRANYSQGIPALGVVGGGPAVPEVSSELVSRLLAEMEAAGVAGSSEAAAALDLARMAVDVTLPAGARVSAHKQLPAAKALAMRAEAKADPVDDVEKRRDAKLRAARGA